MSMLIIMEFKTLIDKGYNYKKVCEKLNISIYLFYKRLKDLI